MRHSTPTRATPTRATATPPLLLAGLAAALLLAQAAAAPPALAYIGPGAGITMLGALWGVVVAVALALGAVLFWPIRAMLRRRKGPAVGTTTTTTTAAADPALAHDATAASPPAGVAPQHQAR